MFEVDVKKCDGTAAGKEEDQLGFGLHCAQWFLPPTPIPVHKDFFPPGKFTLSVKPHPHF